MLDQYKEQYNKITQILMSKFIKKKKGENIVVSPYSIIMLLGIVSHATNGSTRDEILNVIAPGMNMNEAEVIISELRKIMDSTIGMMSSNAVCVREDYAETIYDSYKEELARIFDGKIFMSKNIVSDVNNWVRENTKGMINEILDQSASNTLLCLLNAIAFEAEWDNQYEEDDIVDGEFYNADGSISEVQMLESIEEFFIENEIFKGFLRPYKNGEYMFMGLLPKKKIRNTPLEKVVSNIDFSELYEHVKRMKVCVAMPEFKHEFNENLKGLCQELGIKEVFTEYADFSNMSSADLMAEMIIHKANIEVDRMGTKAAAVTAMNCVESCAPIIGDYENVVLDRAFVYAIINVRTGLPVFVGITNSVGKDCGYMRANARNIEKSKRKQN